MVKIIRDKILNHTVSHLVSPLILGHGLGSYLSSREQVRLAYAEVTLIEVGLTCRQVKPEEGKALAEEWNCAWTEASARHNENVGKAFELVIGEVEKHNAPPAEEKKGCTIS